MATNIRTTKHAVIMSLVTDIVLLFTMLLGLLRMRLRLGGRFGLGDFLWKQVGDRSPSSLYPTFPNVCSLVRVSCGSYLPLLPKSRQWSVWLFFLLL
jgi:hypothetical protein